MAPFGVGYAIAAVNRQCAPAGGVGVARGVPKERGWSSRATYTQARRGIYRVVVIRWLFGDGRGRFGVDGSREQSKGMGVMVRGDVAGCLLSVFTLRER